MRAEEVKRLASAEGYGKKALQGAKDSLLVESHKLGFGAGWEWRLPNRNESEGSSGTPSTK